MSDYYQLMSKAEGLFLEWFECRDKEESKRLYDEYIKTLREAVAVAPAVNDVWANDVLARAERMGDA